MTADSGIQGAMTEADRRLLAMRYWFADFVGPYFDSLPIVEPNSDAEGDQAASGSDHIPNRVIEGSVASAVDHVRAWIRASAPTKDDPRPFVYLYADYTLWRAVLEAVASAIWVLGPDSRVERIERATRLAIYEWKKSPPVARAADPGDEVSARLQAEQRLVIDRVCEQMQFDFESLSKKGGEPSKAVRVAREYLGREGDDFLYWWTICSRYAHAQTLTVMLRSIRTHVDTPHGGVLDVTTDAALLADLAEFTVKATNGLVKLLRRRGLHRTPKSAGTPDVTPGAATSDAY